MDVYLRTDEVATGDLEMVQAQIQENEGVKEDIRTLQENLDNVNEIIADLVEIADNDFTERLTKEVDELNSQWESVKVLSKEQSDRLTRGMEMTEKVHNQIKVLEKYMDSVNREHLAHEYTVHTKEELVQLNTKFKVELLTYLFIITNLIIN